MSGQVAKAADTVAEAVDTETETEVTSVDMEAETAAGMEMEAVEAEVEDTAAAEEAEDTVAACSLRAPTAAVAAARLPVQLRLWGELRNRSKPIRKAFSLFSLFLSNQCPSSIQYMYMPMHDGVFMCVCVFLYCCCLFNSLCYDDGACS